MDILTEFGMGSSLRRGDYTQAAIRAVENALWRNSINAAELFGKTRQEMQLRVVIGVQKPDAVDAAKVAAVFPYGDARIDAQFGGLDIPRPEGSGAPTIVAQATITVSFAKEGAE